MAKGEVIRVRVEPRLRRKAERQAKAEQRTLSSLIRVALSDYVERAAAQAAEGGTK